VPDLDGPRVARESRTVQFAPKVMTSLDGLTADVANLVGVSDDRDAAARATTAVRDRFGDHVSAAQSQPYYLDVTHPDANKGAVARYLSARFQIPPKADRPCTWRWLPPGATSGTARTRAARGTNRDQTDPSRRKRDKFQMTYERLVSWLG
jgi:hypothetical protein